MQAWQSRVIEEKAALDDKLNRLREFLDSDGLATLPEDQRDRLVRQAFAMGNYSAILGERIAAFVECV